MDDEERDATGSVSASAVAARALYVMQPLVASEAKMAREGVEVVLNVDEPGSLPADRPLRVRADRAPAASGQVRGWT